MVTKKRTDRLEIAPVAKTSFKMSMMGLPTGNLGVPNIMVFLPGMTAFATWFMKMKMKALGGPARARIPWDALGWRRQDVRLQDDRGYVRHPEG